MARTYSAGGQPAEPQLVALDPIDVPAASKAAAVDDRRYVVVWVAYPLAMAHLAPLIDRQDELPAFIVAYNWSAVPQMGLMLPLAWLLWTDGEISGWMKALATVGQMGLLVYAWFVVRTALRVSGFVAAGFVLIDLLITMAVDEVGAQMIGTAAA